MNHEDRREVRKEIEKHLSEKECPTCDAGTTMVKVEVWPNADELHIHTRWRCLNCLGIFTETLKPVE